MLNLSRGRFGSAITFGCDGHLLATRAPGRRPADSDRVRSIEARTVGRSGPTSPSVRTSGLVEVGPRYTIRNASGLHDRTHDQAGSGGALRRSHGRERGSCARPHWVQIDVSPDQGAPWRSSQCRPASGLRLTLLRDWRSSPRRQASTGSGGSALRHKPPHLRPRVANEVVRDRAARSTDVNPHAHHSSAIEAPRRTVWVLACLPPGAT